MRAFFALSQYRGPALGHTLAYQIIKPIEVVVEVGLQGVQVCDAHTKTSAIVGEDIVKKCTDMSDQIQNCSDSSQSRDHQRQ